MSYQDQICDLAQKNNLKMEELKLKLKEVLLENAEAAPSPYILDLSKAIAYLEGYVKFEVNSK
ncbi:MAG: hypothetical protein GX568_10485 [Candidatus Gastranaerophilales bacterium]|nr:hypothetical protein [Candidatus Gastranaerophilales bacterium]